jgi:glutamate 5-kinase
MNSFTRNDTDKKPVRVVVKIGSALTTAGQSENRQLQRIVEEISAFVKIGNQVIIVSSGAIANGSIKLGLKRRPVDLPSKQAAAAIGQVGLMNMWEKAFSAFGITVAQILLTKSDFEDRDRYLNTRNTLLKLLTLGVIPVINENDTVATEEINFGDNDTLSSVVASKVDADSLIIFTDVDGLYDGDPRRDKNAKLITEIRSITENVRNWASSKAGCELSIGGMTSKIEAAGIAMKSGVATYIVNGRKNACITDIVADKVRCTKFLPDSRLESRKRWIAFGARVSGRIFVDDGAAKAISESSKSLLPSGITGVKGGFSRGAVVSVWNSSGVEIARGLVFYSANDIEIIKGRKTSEIEKLLCRKDYDEVIHKDNLVIMAKG